ncbi:MAG: hypothetical protein QOF14_2634 [Hyphomicrobiales bacterium]|jgi:Leucine-rich repeat (LRR) protein|nr:hypothetical protein [Hyphomicrobiales bacterium]
MANETKNPGEKLSVSPTKTRTLKPRAETGVMRQSFSHGRSKAVVVEKVKARLATSAEPVRRGDVAAVSPAPPPSGVVLRTLTQEEQNRRLRALEEVRRREWQEHEASRIQDEDKRHQGLRDAARRRTDSEAANREAAQRVAQARTAGEPSLYLGELGDLTILPSFAGLSSLTGLNFAWTRISSLPPLTDVPKLKYLNLCGTEIKDLSFLVNQSELEILILWGTPVADISMLRDLTALKVIDLEGTLVSDLTPLSRLKNLQRLDIRNSRISDLSPLSNLPMLTHLRVSDTRVTDLSPVINLRGLRVGASSDRYFGGLSFVGCPIKDEELLSFAKDPNPNRTRETISYLRRDQAHVSGDDAETEETDESDQTEVIEGQKSNLQPLENIPSPFAFKLSLRGTIALTSTDGNWPVFPYRTSERDHTNRLGVCHTLAEDLISDLDDQKFQVRREYASGLQKYADRLPKQTGDGNILLADAEARMLRTLFAAESDILSVAFASKLKIFLEQHIGLRVFYPEIANFYRDVQTGRIEAPLPLDAVEGLVQGVKDSTPTVFEPSVSEAIEGSAQSPPTVTPLPATEAPPADANQPMPPKDPLGEIDPQKAQDFSFAGTVNRLWKAFLEGEKINKSLDGWTKAGDALRPHVGKILDWLRSFSQYGDGGPPMPPTIGV